MNQQAEDPRKQLSRPKRLDPGGFAYGETPYPLELGQHRDAPLSPRGRMIWASVITLIVVFGIVLVVVAAQY